MLDATGNQLDTLTGVSDAGGVLTVSVVVGAGTTEYVAWSGNLDSSTILVDGLLR